MDEMEMEGQSLSTAPFESHTLAVRPVLFPILLGCGDAPRGPLSVEPILVRRPRSIAVGDRIHRIERKDGQLMVTEVSSESPHCSVYMHLEPGLPDLGWLRSGEQVSSSWTLGVDTEPTALIGGIEATADGDVVHLELEGTRCCRADDPSTRIHLMGVTLESWPCQLRWKGRLLFGSEVRLVTDHFEMV